MFEKFFSATAHDFRQRYEGTYGFYTVDGQRKFLAYLEAISIEDRMAHFQDAKGIAYHVNADTDREIGFEFLPPASVFYNTSIGVMFMERYASKQFRRGVCHHNMHAFKLRAGGFEGQHVNFDTLTPVYESKMGYEKPAQDFLAGKLNAVAISPNIALTVGGGLAPSKGYVYVFQEVVGHYDNKLFSIKLRPSGALFMTEIRDALRNCGLTNIGVENGKA